MSCLGDSSHFLIGTLGSPCSFGCALRFVYIVSMNIDLIHRTAKKGKIMQELLFSCDVPFPERKGQSAWVTKKNSVRHGSLQKRPYYCMEYIRWEMQARKLLYDAAWREAKIDLPIKKQVRIEITVLAPNRKGDVQNLLDGVLDALQSKKVRVARRLQVSQIGAIDNDRQAIAHQIELIAVDKENPCMEVKVFAIN